MEGAIWLHRQLLDSSVFASEKKLKIWIWILLKASYKGRSVPVKIGAGQSIVNLKRGELIFGRFSAEESLNIDGSTIYKILKYFESEKMILIKSNSHFTIITICKYDSYQTNNIHEVTAKEQQSNSKVTSKEQASNTYNKDNNVNKEYKFDFIIDEKLKPIFIDWLEYKKTRKESYKTSKSIEACYNKLVNLSNGNYIKAQQIIDESFSNNWSGFFELKVNKDIKPKENEKTTDFFANTIYGKSATSGN
jgi:hypothetical protein